MTEDNEVRLLRESMCLNRKEFCDYFEIPYRTVQDWESNKRKIPSYLLRLMRYMAYAEKMIKVENGKKES